MTTGSTIIKFHQPNFDGSVIVHGQEAINVDAGWLVPLSSHDIKLQYIPYTGATTCKISPVFSLVD